MPLAAGLAGRTRAEPGAASGLAHRPLGELDRFNYVVGTQTIGATYQFTSESVLVETARAILDMGSNLLKLTMGRGYERMMLKPSKAAYPETMQYLLNQGSDAAQALRTPFPGAAIDPPPSDPRIRSLADLARHEPAYRQVLEMPFAHYLVWTYAFSPRWWHEGFPPEEQAREYAEMREFASYLLRTYRGSGKTFFLGHWEGDWHLRPDLKVDNDAMASSRALQGMADWLNARQRAVDDAKRDTPHRDVEIFHYTEVNHVTIVSMAGRPSVCNSVLPRTHVDYVSYSTYDSLGNIAVDVPKALDYIESRLPAKPSIPGRRVFIGEYGFPAVRVPEPERDRRSREMMRIGLKWGCPFVLCWQMYNNEFKDGRENGYWLIDDQGVKQPLWHTHHEFYRRAKAWCLEFRTRHGRIPSGDEFRQFAVGIL
jgi:hypothetical protein